MPVSLCGRYAKPSKSCIRAKRHPCIEDVAITAISLDQCLFMIVLKDDDVVNLHPRECFEQSCRIVTTIDNIAEENSRNDRLASFGIVILYHE